MVDSYTVPHTRNAVTCKIDDRGRIPLATSLRHYSGASLKVLMGKGYDRWSVRTGKAINGKRYFNYVNLDPTGETSGIDIAQTQARLVIPPAYRTFADLHDDIVIVDGEDSMFEVWALGKWNEYIKIYALLMVK